MERDCESELSKLNIEQNACIYHFGASVIHGQRSNILRLLYKYFDDLDIEFEWVEELYYDCIHVNPLCSELYEEIQEIKCRQQDIMTKFFSKLYEELDIKWCEDHLGQLFNFLKEIQPELKSLYKRLLDIYSA